MTVKTAITLLALLLAAPPLFAQSADDPAYEMLDGIGACMLGDGKIDKTTAALTDIKWTTAADPDTGQVNFQPAAGDRTFGFVTDKVGSCHVESMAIGTDDAQTMFNLFLLGGNSGIEVTETGTDADGCTTHTLSTGAVAVLTSGGNDPTCASEKTSAFSFTFAPGN